MLGLYAISIINIIPLLPTSSTQKILEIYASVPWYQIWYWATFLLAAAIFIGLLNWKRLAVYTFFSLGTINLIINNFILEPYSPWYFNIIAGLAGSALWFWVIKRKWQFFK